MAVVSACLHGIRVPILLLMCQTVQAEWFSQQQSIMGTVVTVELHHAEPGQATRCADQVFAEMRRIDELMSPYRPDSEVSSVNRDAGIEAVRIGDELFSLLQQANDFSVLSAGAFDITFASIGYHYDYRREQQPSQNLIDETLPAVDYRKLMLKDRMVRFASPGMRIDLGGIAKGYAVDRSVELLQRCGISEALVSAGGDSRILGDRGGRPWMMGIQHPRTAEGLALAIPLANSAISTSGDYQRFFLRNGERIHHIIDPDTGKSANRSWSVSVIGPNATATDALSTTLFVLGAEQGLALIETLEDMDAIIIDSEGVIHYSSGLKDPLAERGENRQKAVSGRQVQE